MHQVFTLFLYLEQVIVGWEKFTQMQIVYLNKRRNFLIAFTKQKNGKRMLLLQLILMKVFLYEVLSPTLMSYETAGQMLGQLQSFLSYSSTHKHSDIWQALSVNNTVRNSQPWYLSHRPILPSLLCSSPLLFKLISSLLTLHTSGISFLYICFARAVNFFVTFK